MEAVPANARPLRRLGVLPCCVGAVQRNSRTTRSGSQMQCPVCLAVLVVDTAGAWKLQEHSSMTPSTASGD